MSDGRAGEFLSFEGKSSRGMSRAEERRGKKELPLRRRLPLCIYSWGLSRVRIDGYAGGVRVTWRRRRSKNLGNTSYARDARPAKLLPAIATRSGIAVYRLAVVSSRFISTRIPVIETRATREGSSQTPATPRALALYPIVARAFARYISIMSPGGGSHARIIIPRTSIAGCRDDALITTPLVSVLIAGRH